MSNVIELASYIRKTDAHSTTALPAEALPDWSVVQGQEVQASGALNASVLLRLDPDAELSRFFVLTTEAISQIEECGNRLAIRDALGADDALMASKIIFSELLMYREISDAVGLVAFRLFEAVCGTKAVTDAPLLPDTIKQALQKISAEPFMDFDVACKIATEIENAVPPLKLPGYDEFASELIADAEAYIPE